MGSCGYSLNAVPPPDACDQTHHSYLAKFLASGALSWVVMMELWMPDRLAVDGGGNIVVGYHGSGDTVYLRRHDPTGSQLWEVPFPPSGGMTHFVEDLVCDSSGNILFSSDVAGGLLTKLDPGGNVLGQWSPVSTSGNRLAVDAANHILLAGGEHVVPMDPAGAVLSTTNLGTGWHTTARAADSTGNVLLGGYIDEPILLGSVALAPTDDGDLMVLVLTPSLAYLASRLLPGRGQTHRIEDIAAAADGGVIVGGHFDGTIDLGQGPATSAGYIDGFIARLEPQAESADTGREACRSSSGRRIEGDRAWVVGRGVGGLLCCSGKPGPIHVRERHFPDERSDFSVHCRSATPMSAPPGPVLSESCSVPLEHRRGLHHAQHLVPVGPPSPQDHPESAVCVRQPRTLHRSPKHTELLAQREVLHGQLMAGAKA